MSDYDGVEHELVPGVLRGFRQWRLYPTGLLASINGWGWKLRVNTASCVKVVDRECTCDLCRTSHQVPAPSCTCGFYALHRPRWIYDRFSPSIISGTIKASGRVILGTKGFRAQYAEIEALAVTGNWARKLSEAFTVPVFDDEQALLEQFPPIPVDELLGPPPEPEGVDLRIYASGYMSGLFKAFMEAKYIEKEQ